MNLATIPTELRALGAVMIGLLFLLFRALAARDQEVYRTRMIATGFAALLGAILVAAIGFSGCASVPPTMTATAPCLSAPIPPRAKFKSYGQPRPVEIETPDGPKEAVLWVVDGESLGRFFGYVETVEAAALKAQTCLAPPTGKDQTKK